MNRLEIAALKAAKLTPDRKIRVGVQGMWIEDIELLLPRQTLVREWFDSLPDGAVFSGKGEVKEAFETYKQARES